MLNMKAAISPHFTVGELACHCGGKFKGCHVAIINGKLVHALEVLRNAYYPKGLRVVDSYRCPIENARAESASGQRIINNSQHVLGTAADIPPVATLAQVQKLGVFTGIGWQKATGLVTHVDVRSGDAVSWSYPLGK